MTASILIGDNLLGVCVFIRGLATFDLCHSERTLTEDKALQHRHGYVHTLLPASDPTVMLFDKNASGPVWPGYLDGGTWRYADGMPAQPTHRAEMPEGPQS